jgi:hypothetical protein
VRRSFPLACLLALVLAGASGAEPGPTVAVRPSGILLGGRPFFPTMVWAACPQDVEADLAAGINLFMGSGERCGSEGDLLAAIGGRAYYVPSIGNGTGLLADPRVIGYHQQDEPDGWGIPPERLPFVRDTLVFLTLTPHFAQEQDPLSPTVTKAIYTRYIAKGNVIGFDLYPLAHFCRHPRIGLSSVYAEQRDLVGIARGKPTFQWLETGAQDESCGPAPVTGTLLQTEAWLAIAGGARGLGYFTYAWPGGVARSNAASAEVMAAIAQVNRRIRQLSAVLLAPALPQVFSSRRAQVKIGARKVGPTTYLIAVNPFPTARSWSRTLPGLITQKVAVVGENRWAHAVDGRLRDRFGPYSTHVYAWETSG